MKRKPQLTPAFDLKLVHDSAPDPALVRNQSAAACQAVSHVKDYLSLGSWKDAADAQLLKSLGVTHVLNCAKECMSESINSSSSDMNDYQTMVVGSTSPNPPNKLGSGDNSPMQQLCSDSMCDVTPQLQGFVVKRLPMDDKHHEDIATHFQTAFDFVEGARLSGGHVLVHCRRGISRSAAIVTGYLMYKEHMTYDEALDYVKARRPGICLNLAFRAALEAYQPPQRRQNSEQYLTDSTASSVDKHNNIKVSDSVHREATAGNTGSSGSTSSGGAPAATAIASSSSQQQQQQQERQRSEEGVDRTST